MLEVIPPGQAADSSPCRLENLTSLQGSETWPMICVDFKGMTDWEWTTDWEKTVTSTKRWNNPNKLTKNSSESSIPEGGDPPLPNVHSQRHLIVEVIMGKAGVTNHPPFSSGFTSTSKPQDYKRHKNRLECQDTLWECNKESITNKSLLNMTQWYFLRNAGKSH